VAPKLLGSDARPMAQLGLASMADSVHGTILDCTPVGEDLRLRLRPAPTGVVERPDGERPE
jgi:riboflavin biosynthesis pyrimidine reductase